MSTIVYQVGPFAYSLKRLTRHSQPVFFSAFTFAFIAFVFSAVQASADEIKLRRGGTFRGTVNKTPEENNGFYEFQLESGGLLKIAKNEVDSIVAPQSSVADYQKELVNHNLATVQGQLEMAEWCQKNKLRLQKVKHLRQAIAIDPDQEQARRLLGYTRHVRTGKWVLRDEYYQSIGYVRSGTSMRLPQARIVEAEEKSHREAVAKWKSDINRWLTLLRSPKKFAEAKQNLEDIDSVKAIPGLIAAYQKLSNKRQLSNFDRDVLSLLMNVIAKFDILSAKSFLVDRALNESNDILQDEAEQILKNKYAQWTADYIISRLNRIPPRMAGMIKYRDALALQHFVNRAATILQGLEADISEAILPMINLLVVQRVLEPMAIPKKGGLGGASFGSDGSMSMSQGSEKPKPIPVTIKMEPVKVALIKETEQRFEYDQSAWLQWYLNRSMPNRVDLRRLD